MEYDNKDKNAKWKSNAKKAESGLSNLGKVPPQARSLEEAVLGALMIDKDAVAIVIDILQSASFYEERHQKIFKAISLLFEQSSPIDLLTTTEQLKKNGDLELIGGPYYLVELTNRIASSANVEYHARIIAQKFIQRELIRVSTETINLAYEDTTDVFDLLDRSEQNLFSITEGSMSRGVMGMSTLMNLALKQIEELSKKEDGLTGVPSGFTALDRLTSGWQPSDLVILAARPGMGKCMMKGTYVYMFDFSLKKVEDIRPDDLLMGDDGTPRRVLSIAQGREQMYWVHQNKGISYGVNESHILSLKRSRNEGKHKHGDIINISVAEYLEKSDKWKTNYKGYKVAIEAAAQPLDIEPYFLGLWLGDGGSTSTTITNIDAEVISYLSDYAERLEMRLTLPSNKELHPDYRITSIAGKGNRLLPQLQKLKLINNKHIPHVYLANSIENRLQLLAGLLDSDGHYLVDSNGYEITQKNEALARQIKQLCDTLGFRTSLKSKKASIKKIGYECTVWRIRIYGDVDKIPLRIEYKKAKPWASKVDWRMTGIRVEKDVVGDYYGFELDGNGLFLLEDMTVTHNTSLTLAITRNAAVDFGKPVAFFSLEMSSVQLVNRLIALETEIPSEKLRKGQLEQFEWQQLHSGIAKLSNVPIFLDDTPGLSIFELRAKCRRLKMQHDIQLIIIDYLQLMTAGGENKNGNREQEIANISRSLKGLAKELNVPVIALAQLSRAVEVRGGSKRPQLSDLRESGSIEQDADIVGFIYRPEYYGILEDEDGNNLKGIGEIIIAKHRNGALDSVRLKWDGQYAKFSNLGDEDFSAFSGSSSSIDAFGQNDKFDSFGSGGDGEVIASRLNSSDKVETNFNTNGFHQPPPPSSLDYSEDVPF